MTPLSSLKDLEPRIPLLVASSRVPPRVPANFCGLGTCCGSAAGPGAAGERERERAGGARRWSGPARLPAALSPPAPRLGTETGKRSSKAAKRHPLTPAESSVGWSLAATAAGKAPRTFPLLLQGSGTVTSPLRCHRGMQAAISPTGPKLWELKTSQQDALGGTEINSQCESSANRRLLWRAKLGCDIPNRQGWRRWWVAGGKDHPRSSGKGEQHRVALGQCSLDSSSGVRSVCTGAL